eukprot:406528_1
MFNFDQTDVHTLRCHFPALTNSAAMGTSCGNSTPHRVHKVNNRTETNDSHPVPSVVPYSKINGSSNKRRAASFMYPPSKRRKRNTSHGFRRQSIATNDYLIDCIIQSSVKVKHQQTHVVATPPTQPTENIIAINNTQHSGFSSNNYKPVILATPNHA